MELTELLHHMIENGASDLHLAVGSPPQIRVDGRLMPVGNEPLTAKETRQLCYSVLTDSQKKKFEENNELDLSIGVKGLSRFRANMYMQRGAVSGAFRNIPYKVLSFQELGLPPMVKNLTLKPQGLVLVTGPTGSGKSTTLAAMIDEINKTRQNHIITIEDPIEYVHPHKKCLINQREVGTDTSDFKNALRYILRQDPDVVLIGELRDLETIESALTVAETGHLAFSTLHTNSCVQTINRIIDVFPAFAQHQVRIQLSMVLEGVLSQQLIPKMNGKGRALAVEIMFPNPAIRNLIREEKVHQIYSQMQVGQAKFGMQTMNQSLYTLIQRRQISQEEAMMRSTDPEELKSVMAGNGQAGRQMGNVRSDQRGMTNARRGR